MVYTGPQVHRWHEAVDWTAVADAGHTYGWIPATAGMATVDPRFRGHWEAMAAAGLVRGAVHDLSTSYVGRGEARHFVSVLGDPTGVLTALAVRPDGPRVTDRMPSLEQVADFAGEFARLTDGHPLVIKTSWRWWARRDARGRGREISPFLWHSDSLPTGTMAWGWPRYGGWGLPTFWGVRRASCPGIAGLSVVSAFAGDLRALSTLAGLEVDDVDEVERQDDVTPAARAISWLRDLWLRRTPARR